MNITKAGIMLTSILLMITLAIGCTTSAIPGPTGTELPPSSYLPEIPRIGIEEVKAKLDAGAKIVIVDSRSKASYERFHIAGAISIPERNMAGTYDNLDGYDEIVTY